MKQYVLTLDLKDDPELIAAYEAHHKKVWPEVLESIRDSGIEHMHIYRYKNRLCMMIQASADFSFDKKAAMDAANEKVQEWETLMWRYQQAPPGAPQGAKWMLMEPFFEL